ncbi:MAG TPA: hypothetical protein VFI47_16890 [Acidimicrobiales bacterium]|nr:hypothetical protein [Acidimicrobiales bacterium]
MPDLVVVERLVATEPGIDMCEYMWDLALDQRAFGPRRVLVALTDRYGGLLELAHAERTEPPEVAFGLCLHGCAAGAVAAVAYCDEPVEAGSRPGLVAEVAERFAAARLFARRRGVHLVDWIACDDLIFRSFRMTAEHDAAAGGWGLA